MVKLGLFFVLYSLSSAWAVPPPSDDHEKKEDVDSFRGAPEIRQRTQAKTMSWEDFIEHACTDLLADVKRHPDTKRMMKALDAIKTNMTKDEAAAFEKDRREYLVVASGDPRKEKEIAKRMKKLIVDSANRSKEFEGSQSEDNVFKFWIGWEVSLGLQLGTGSVILHPAPGESKIPMVWGDVATSNVELPNGQKISEFMKSLPEISMELKLESEDGYEWKHAKLSGMSRDNCRRQFPLTFAKNPKIAKTLKKEDTDEWNRIYEEKLRGPDNAPVILESTKPFSIIAEAASKPYGAKPERSEILKQLAHESYGTREAGSQSLAGFDKKKLAETVEAGVRDGDPEILHRLEGVVGQGKLQPTSNKVIADLQKQLKDSPTFRYVDKFRQDLAGIIDPELLPVAKRAEFVADLEKRVGAKNIIVNGNRVTADIPYREGTMRVVFTENAAHVEMASAPPKIPAMVEIAPTKLNGGTPFVLRNQTSLDLPAFTAGISTELVFQDGQFHLSNTSLYDDKKRPGSRIRMPTYVADYLIGPGSSSDFTQTRYWAHEEDF